MLETSWTDWTKVDKMDSKLDLKDKFRENEQKLINGENRSKMDNLDKIRQHGQKLDNMDRNWTKLTDVDNMDKN